MSCVRASRVLLLQHAQLQCVHLLHCFGPRVRSADGTADPACLQGARAVGWRAARGGCGWVRGCISFALLLQCSPCCAPDGAPDSAAAMYSSTRRVGARIALDTVSYWCLAFWRGAHGARISDFMEISQRISRTQNSFVRFVRFVYDTGCTTLQMLSLGRSRVFGPPMRRRHACHACVHTCN